MHRKNILRLAGLAAACSFIGFPGVLLAAERGAPAEAEALVRKAGALIKSAGAEKAFEEITNGKAFKDRDLYVFVYDLNGKCLAHGANAKLVGKDLIGLKDPDGKPLVKILVDVAKDKGQGWTETVKFRNPVTDKIQTRVNYIERVGDFAVGSGVFKD
jgi:signal transduction histidine kinase